MTLEDIEALYHSLFKVDFDVDQSFYLLESLLKDNSFLVEGIKDDEDLDLPLTTDLNEPFVTALDIVSNASHFPESFVIDVDLALSGYRRSVSRRITLLDDWSLVNPNRYLGRVFFVNEAVSHRDIACTDLIRDGVLIETDWHKNPTSALCPVCI